MCQEKSGVGVVMNNFKGVSKSNVRNSVCMPACLFILKKKLGGNLHDNFAIHVDYCHAVMQSCHADYQNPLKNAIRYVFTIFRYYKIMVRRNWTKFNDVKVKEIAAVHGHMAILKKRRASLPT